MAGGSDRRMIGRKRRLRRAKRSRDQFRMEADERAARAALRPHTGAVVPATIYPPSEAHK
jgi:thymidine kinase